MQSDSHRRVGAAGRCWHARGSAPRRSPRAARIFVYIARPHRTRPRRGGWSERQPLRTSRCPRRQPPARRGFPESDRVIRAAHPRWHRGLLGHEQGWSHRRLGHRRLQAGQHVGSRHLCRGWARDASRRNEGQACWSVIIEGCCAPGCRGRVGLKSRLAHHVRGGVGRDRAGSGRGSPAASRAPRTPARLAPPPSPSGCDWHPGCATRRGLAHPESHGSDVWRHGQRNDARIRL